MTVTGLVRRPYPGLICACGHLDGEHDLAKDNRTRKRCFTGNASGTGCDCLRFELVLRRYVVVGFEDEPA